MEIQLNALYTVVIAVILYWLGDWLVKKISFLDRCCIPAPLVGGLVFVVVNTAMYASGRNYFRLGEEIQSVVMCLFFTAAGFAIRAPARRGMGKTAAVCLALVCVLVLAQNILGAGVLLAMGADALTDGSDTAADSFGLVMGCVLGGPAAAALIRRHDLNGWGVLTGRKRSVRSTTPARVASMVSILLFCMLAGLVMTGSLSQLIGFRLPGYIGGMVVAMVFRNTTELTDEEFPDAEAAAISNMTLGVFVTMAMMGLRVWGLTGLTGPEVVALVLQTLLLLAFGWLLVFRKLGGDYSAAVMTAGFIGGAMGTESGAVANMQAVTRRFGPAPAAFFLIPAAGIFAEFANEIIVSVIMPVLGNLL